MSCAAIIVTYRRPALLRQCLAAVCAQSASALAGIILVDNDANPEIETLARSDARIVYLPQRENLGGAGGFRCGVEYAFAQGFTHFWLMDDDVVPAHDCLAQLLASAAPIALPLHRDPEGRNVERAAMVYDLKNPFCLNPKRETLAEHYPEALPPQVPVASLSFEGALFTREVVAAIGAPKAQYFIFYDDLDYALRARRAGFTPILMTTATMTRCLPFDRDAALASWKGYFMYRNFFAIHFLFGENALVRAKPYFLALAALLLSPFLPPARKVPWRCLRVARNLARELAP